MKLEFATTQDRINHEMLILVKELQCKQTNSIEILAKICGGQDEQIKLLQESIKLTDTIVSANGIALNNIEKDLYIDKRFAFNDDSLKCDENIKIDVDFKDTCIDFAEYAIDVFDKSDCDTLAELWVQYQKFMTEEVFKVLNQDKPSETIEELTGVIDEPETKHIDIADAVEELKEIAIEYRASYGKQNFQYIVLDTCFAWIKAELHDKNLKQ